MGHHRHHRRHHREEYREREGRKEEREEGNVFEERIGQAAEQAGKTGREVVRVARTNPEIVPPLKSDIGKFFGLGGEPRRESFRQARRQATGIRTKGLGGHGLFSSIFVPNSRKAFKIPNHNFVNPYAQATNRPRRRRRF